MANRHCWIFSIFHGSLAEFQVIGKGLRPILLDSLSFGRERALIPRKQYGFKKGHGTSYRILYFGQRVRDAQDHKPIPHTIAAFLDMSKAFNTVLGQKLITKFYDSFGIKEKALSCLSDFLKDRIFKVMYKNPLSDKFSLKQSIHQ
ncbi:reverse transcriptase domain-containing protein [Caerostris extrusa]|uniref:Reverse transcriptase domain-containing protein n=1 Tax=Caerostris extrusa TaxID=172846 RepID=A0AAV4MFC4_CAEEX|nr:reverse transcriptase domain-containing protein [Caerostris extrusa]